MPDIIDNAQEHIEREEAARNAQVRMKSQQRTLVPLGACHYCSEPVDNPKPYCSGECAEDHAAELRQKKALGR